MKRLSSDTLIEIVFVLIGLIFGLLEFSIADSETLESIFKAFIVASLLFISERLLQIRSAQKQVKPAREEFVRTNRNLTGALVAEVHHELERAIRVVGDQYIVDHSTLSILSYDIFWRLLSDDISGRGASMTVQTIHSCAIDVWLDHPTAQSLLARQRAFCDRGGTIVRILCDRGSEPSERVREAARRMSEAGIRVRYYDLMGGKVHDHDFAWDFARVAETGDAAVWDSFANRPGGVIGVATYLNSGEYRGKNLEYLWAEVDRNSRDIKPVEEVVVVPASG